MRRALRGLSWAAALSLTWAAGTAGGPLDDLKTRAHGGDPQAQASLGFAYATGSGVSQDLEEGAQWLRRAAEAGDSAAQFNLGLLCARGQGLPQDWAEAAKWYRKAADQGNPGAQYNLGLLCARGQGVRQDHGEAARLYRQAADRGHAASQYNLGVLYHKGLGVPRDPVQALFWLSLAGARAPAERRDEWLRARETVAARLTREQLVEAETLAGDWKPLP